MRIVITGTPGTGKSIIAEKLAAALGLELVDIKQVVLEKKLRARGGEVDIRALARSLSFLKRKKDFVAEGHLACEVRLPADVVIVLRTHPAVLRQRLLKRRYGSRKLEENLMAEMLDYCTQRAGKVYGKKPLELDTTRKSVPVSVSRILKALKHKNKNLDSVDYSGELIRFLKVLR